MNDEKGMNDDYLLWIARCENQDDFLARRNEFRRVANAKVEKWCAKQGGHIDVNYVAILFIRLIN